MKLRPKIDGVVASETKMSDEPNAPITKTEGFLLTTIIFLALLVVHRPLRYFFFGDSWHVLHLLLIDWKAIFTIHNEHLMPLFKALYFLQYRIFGAHHLPYEGVLLGLHAVNSTLVYRLGRRMTLRLWPSVSACLIFAFSSVHWEVTGWSFEQCFVLSTLWMLIAIDISWQDPQESSRLLAVALASLAAFWSGPISLGLPVILCALLGLRASKKGESLRRSAMLWHLLAIWIPVGIYFASLRAATTLNQVLAIQNTHLTLQRIPQMIDFTLFGSSYGLTLPTLTFVAPRALASSGIVLFLFILFLVFCYRSFSGQQRQTFWFLLCMIFFSLLAISIGRSQMAGDVALASRYMYFPMAALGLLLALCWQTCRDSLLQGRSPLLVSSLGVTLVAYFLVFHAQRIRGDNPAAQRGLLSQEFLTKARRATYPDHISSPMLILGPELPVPPYVSAPGYRPLWQIFQVLDGNTNLVVPVKDYLHNKDASLPANLVRNGGFEKEPSPSRWKTFGGASFQLENQAAHSGRWGVKTLLPGHGSALSLDVIDHRPTPLEPGIFTFAVDVKVDKAGAAAARIIFKGASDDILQAVSSLPHSGDGQWSQLVVSALAPTGTCIVGVDVSNQSPGSATSMVDDAILVLHPGTVDAYGRLSFSPN